MDQLEPIEKGERRRAARAAARAPALDAQRTPTTRSRTTARPSTPRGVTRAISRGSRISRSFRSPPRPSCARTIPSACSPCRWTDIVRVHASSGTTGKPTVVGYTQEDIDTWSARDGALDPRRRAGARPTSSTSPTATACSPAAWARTTAPRRLGRDGDPGERRHDRAPGAADPRFQARHHHGARPRTCSAIGDEFERQGCDPSKCGLRVGIFGAEPWTEGMRARDREALRHRRRSTCTACRRSSGPGVAQECIETTDGLDRLGGPLLPGDRRSGDRRACCPTARRASSVFTSLTKVRHAGDPLPHARPHAPACPAPRAPCGAWRASPAARDDMLIIRGVNVFPSQIEEILLASDKLVAALRARGAARRAPRTSSTCWSSGAPTCRPV